MKPHLLTSFSLFSALFSAVVSIAAWGVVRKAEETVSRGELAGQLGQAIKQAESVSATFQEAANFLNAAVSDFKARSRESQMLSDKGMLRASEQIAELNKILSDIKSLYTPSPEIIKRLEGLEHALSGKSVSPETIEDSERLRSELKALSDSMPPLVQEALLPRMVPLRWAVQSLWTVRSYSGGDESKAELLVEALDAVLEAQPEGVPAGIRDLVVTTRQKAEQKVTASRRSAIIEQAQQSLLTSDTEVLSSAWNALDGLDKKDDNIIGLQREVRTKMIGQEIRSQSEEFQRQLVSLGSVGDEGLQQSGFAKVYEAAVGYKLALMMDAAKAVTSTPELERVIDDSGRAIKAALEKKQLSDAERMRDYQKWALERIQRFQKTYDAVEENVNNQGFGRRSWRDEHYSKVGAAMINELAPISTNLLDPAVGQLYHKAFQRGWVQLEGRDEQLSVAEQSVAREKKTPDTCRK